jgi:2-haloacid dehalogenase
MAQVDALRASIKVCMFDQYGTVVDMQTGLTEAATPFLAAKGWQGDPNSFVTWWLRTHFENSMIDALLHREHTSYREIGHRSVAFVLERAGIPHTLDEVRDLVAHIERLRPFPEVPEALARIQTRDPLVILSISDKGEFAFQQNCVEEANRRECGKQTACAAPWPVSARFIRYRGVHFATDDRRQYRG